MRPRASRSTSTLNRAGRVGRTTSKEIKDNRLIWRIFEGPSGRRTPPRIVGASGDRVRRPTIIDGNRRNASETGTRPSERFVQTENAETREACVETAQPPRFAKAQSESRRQCGRVSAQQHPRGRRTVDDEHGDVPVQDTEGRPAAVQGSHVDVDGLQVN